MIPLSMHDPACSCAGGGRQLNGGAAGWPLPLVEMVVQGRRPARRDEYPIVCAATRDRSELHERIPDQRPSRLLAGVPMVPWWFV